MAKYGRRPAIVLSGVFFFFGPVFMASSFNIPGLVVGRVIIGLGIGASAVVVPAFLGEVSPARLRGRIVELYEALLCVGMLAATLIDAALESAPESWRWMVGLPILPAFIMTTSIFFLPESPRWLVIHGRLEEALIVLHKILAGKAPLLGEEEPPTPEQLVAIAEAEDALLQLWSSVEKDSAATLEQRQAAAEFTERRRRKKSTMEEETVSLTPAIDIDSIPEAFNTANNSLNNNSYKAKGFWATLGTMFLDIKIVATGPERRAFRMALWLAFFNQAFASTAIINYAPTLLQLAGVHSETTATLFSAAISGSKLVGISFSFLLVDSKGRRPLLIWGSMGSSLAMALLAVADGVSSVALLLVGMCLFIFAFSLSWAGVFWVLLSEIFSMHAKSPAAATSTALLFLSGAIADSVFLSLHGALGAFSFAIFAVIAAIAGIYCFVAVPETKNKQLLEVQRLLAVDSHRYIEDTHRLLHPQHVDSSSAEGVVELVQPREEEEEEGPFHATTVHTS